MRKTTLNGLVTSTGNKELKKQRAELERQYAELEKQQAELESMVAEKHKRVENLTYQIIRLLKPQHIKFERGSNVCNICIRRNGDITNTPPKTPQIGARVVIEMFD